MNQSLSLSIAEQQSLISNAEAAVSHFTKAFSHRLGSHFFSREDIQDMVQDTLLKAWRSIDSYDPTKGKMSTWVSRIAINCVKDEVDRRVRRIFISDSMYTVKKRKDEEDLEEADEWIENPQVLEVLCGDSADRLAERRDFERAVHGEIHKLSGKNQRFAKMLEDGYAPRQMAAIEGCTPNAAAKRVCDIRRALRAALADVAGEFGFRIAC